MNQKKKIPKTNDTVIARAVTVTVTMNMTMMIVIQEWEFTKREQTENDAFLVKIKK
jgi:hypothetical protein